MIDATNQIRCACGEPFPIIDQAEYARRVAALVELGFGDGSAPRCLLCDGQSIFMDRWNAPQRMARMSLTNHLKHRHAPRVACADAAAFNEAIQIAKGSNGGVRLGGNFGMIKCAKCGANAEPISEDQFRERIARIADAGVGAGKTTKLGHPSALCLCCGESFSNSRMTLITHLRHLHAAQVCQLAEEAIP